MSGHGGGFSICNRVAERVLRDIAPVRAVAVHPGGGLGNNPVVAAAINHDKPLDQVFDQVFGKGDGNMKGFRHFLPADLPGHEFMIDGKAPHKGKVVTDRLRELMSRLSRRMDLGFTWPDHTDEARHQNPNLKNWENPEIPSGYTYLLQLVAHDMVATSLPLSVLEDTTTGDHNTRSAALRLDTIYGGGPALCPFAYAIDQPSDTTRTALRLGPINRADPDDPKKKRDIARTPAPVSSGVYRKGLTEIAIADPRNDDQPIISQMTTLFHWLHNTVLGLLPPAKAMVVADSVLEAEYDRFLCARGAVTLIYRQIIRNDLLPRILHPAVYKLYHERPPGFEFLDAGAGSPEGDARIPLEFAHAAFRFGHAMVRQRYLFNERPIAEFDLSDVLIQTSARMPESMPLEPKWIARWSYFFRIAGEQPPRNLSRRIGPEHAPAFIGLFPAIDQEGKGKEGLAYRDLLVGGFLNLWSVPALIDIVRVRRPELFKQSRLLAKNDYRDSLREFLSTAMATTGLTGQDVDTLVKDPPLAFFVLWEAAADPDTRGLKLGLLGSIIVAEAIYAAMARDPVFGETGAGSLKAALERLSINTYKRNCLDEVDEINSMEELVRFVARRNALGDEDPAFI